VSLAALLCPHIWHGAPEFRHPWSTAITPRSDLLDGYEEDMHPDTRRFTTPLPGETIFISSDKSSSLFGQQSGRRGLSKVSIFNDNQVGQSSVSSASHDPRSISYSYPACLRVNTTPFRHTSADHVIWRYAGKVSTSHGIVPEGRRARRCAGKNTVTRRYAG
jgi:hypothetical protein